MQHIVLEADFIYTAVVVPRGKRNPVSECVRSTVPIRLAITDPGEFRLAAEVTPRWNEKKGLVPLFWNGSNLFRPTQDDTDALTADKLAASLRDMAKTPLAAVQNEPILRHGKAIQEGPYDGKWLRDDKVDRIHAIVEAASNLIMHDGCFIEAAPEPVIQVSSENYGVSLSVKDLDRDIVEMADFHRLYRLDHLAMAVEEARAELEARGGRSGYLSQPSPFRVHLAEALQFDEPGTSFTAAARRALGHLKEDLHEMPKEVVIAWLRVRDALGPKGDPTVSEELLRACVDYARLIPDPVHWDRNEDREKLEAALQRWERDTMQPAAVCHYSP